MALEESIEYLYDRMGFSIIPCVYGRKTSAIKWEPYTKRRPTREEVERWFFGRKKYNLAICCGGVSGNLVVIDFDSIESAKRLLDPERLLDERRGTLVVRTGGGGVHVYFRTKRPLDTVKLPKLGIEFRSEGTYVLAPPSIHPSGRPYEYLNTPDRLPVVPDFVEGFRRVIRDKFGVEVDFGRPAPAERPELAYDKRVHPPCFRYLLKGVKEGFRNEAAIRLASYWYAWRKLKPDRVWELLRRWNRRNQPALPEGELRNVWRSEVRKGYRYGCPGMSQMCEPEKCPRHKARVRRVTRLLRDAPIYTDEMAI